MSGTSSAAKVLYRSIPKKAQALPALGFACCQVSQFGGAITLSNQPTVKKGKDVFTIVVGLDEYNCEKGSWYTNGKPECTTAPGATFTWPVTLRVNNLGPGNAVGELLAEETKTFTMPYRPSQNNAKCQGAHSVPNGPENYGAWYDQKNKGMLHRQLLPGLVDAADRESQTDCDHQRRVQHHHLRRRTAGGKAVHGRKKRHRNLRQLPV